MAAVKRDTEYIFGYPPLTEKIDPRQVWETEAEKKQIGFYLHIPFCQSICKYCPFNKRLWRPSEVASYLSALKKEIDLVSRQPSLKKAVVAAGYLGGGTPTALSTDQLVDLLAHCMDRFRMAPAAELTIEANPDSTPKEKMQALLKVGVNRISFGVQSFDDRVLSMLGCRHRSHQAVAALKDAFAAGFDNVGLDLLYRLPGQSLWEWQRQLETALSLNLPHITTPELAIETGTPLYKEQQAGKIPAQPDETRTLAMYERSRRLLIGSGYRHYNLGYDFSLEGKECLYHRMNWQAPQQEVVGLGAGAYSYINGATYFNLYSLADYIESLGHRQLPVGVGKKLSVSERMARFMVQGVYFVRLSKQAFARQFGRAVDEVYGDVLRQLERQGWIANGPDEIALTSDGEMYVNNVSKAFYEEKYLGGAYAQQ
jgi:oxygen-independent coproporphyrinogen-3 oxidase